MSSIPFSGFRRPLATLPAAGLTLAGVAIALYWMSTSIAREQYRNLVIAVVLAQVLWVVFRWRSSVHAFMVFIVTEGFLLNYFWTVPELNILKDIFVIMLFVVVASVLVPRGIFPIPRTIWFVPFLGFSVIYFLQIFNPSLPNLLVGLVGVRATLMFFLLMPVGFWFFDSRERCIRFFVFLNWLSVPTSLFGIFQYFVGPAWMVALSPGFGRAVYFAYGRGVRHDASYFRTFSTFVHTGGFGIYLTFMLLVSVALWSLPSLRAYRKWILGTFALQFLALLTTGSRGSLVFFVAAVGLLALLHRKTARLVPILILVPVMLWGSMFVVGPGFVDRFETLFDFDYVMDRNVGLMYGWLMESMNSEWTGLGAGYASVAARHAGETPLNRNAVENGLAKVRFEAGVPGFVLYLIFILFFMVDCLRAPGRVADPELRWLSSACAVFLFVNLMNISMGTPFDASPTNTYLWFFAGFLARAPLLMPEQNAAAAAQQELPARV